MAETGSACTSAFNPSRNTGRGAFPSASVVFKTDRLVSFSVPSRMPCGMRRPGWRSAINARKEIARQKNFFCLIGGIQKNVLPLLARRRCCRWITRVACHRIPYLSRQPTEESSGTAASRSCFWPQGQYKQLPYFWCSGFFLLRFFSHARCLEQMWHLRKCRL